jgi:hypothetical protein
VASIPWSRVEQITKFLKQKGAEVWIACKPGLSIHVRGTGRRIEANMPVADSGRGALSRTGAEMRA